MSSYDYEQLEARIKKLEGVVFNTAEKFEISTVPTSKLDWSLNERAFVSKYVGGLKSGTEKFVLLVAYLAKGDEQTKVALKDIQQLWGKMTASSLLGMKYNGKYSTEAKTRGWVNSPAQGMYELAYGWEEVLNNEQPAKPDSK
ncbi:MAG TPA: hypothetical protein PKD19_03585 [Candidatus Saccharibacteria bacterium]|nr:hypothetical protein [Candidatus Saccharibacteria bacterium]